jgi:hypothetical protein
MIIMNKFFNIKPASLLLALTLGFTACQDKLEEEFYNPEKQTEPKFDLLFTGALIPTELFRLEYGPGYHQARAFNRMLGLGVFPDGGYNGMAPGSYALWTNWSGVTLRETQFNKVYVDFNKNIPVMNLLLNNLPEEEKANYEIYVDCINIVKAFMFQRLTDIYDDVPFSEANGAYQNKFWAKYDSQESIYRSLLADLETIEGKLDGYELNTSGPHTNFKVADILNNGDVLAWRKFANSMRLRMGMRLTNVDPETTKSIVRDIVSNNLPMISESNDFIGMAETDMAHIMEYYWPRAMNEMWYNFTAPRFILHDVFGYKGPGTPTEDIDPRLYVVFQPNAFGDYIGLDVWGTNQLAIAEADMTAFGYDAERIQTAKDWTYDDHLEPHFSMYNKMTYYNYDMEYPAFTPTETNLLLAEAVVRYPAETAGLNAADLYRKAIRASIDWYYSVNAANSFSTTSSPAIPLNVSEGSQPAKPAESVINAFLDKKVAAFQAMSASDKIKEIYYQKLTHLNVLNYWEIWSETRRLMKEYPALPQNSVFTWMERFYYPSTEATTNPDNFDKVAYKNDHDTPVWWTGRTK